MLLIAWLVASVLKFLVKKAVSLTKLDERLSKYGALEEGEKVTFGQTLANAIFWLGQHSSKETSAYLRDLYRSLEETELREQFTV